MKHEKPYVIASQRRWNAGLARRLAARTGGSFIHIDDTAGLSEARLATLSPRYVFVARIEFSRVAQRVDGLVADVTIRDRSGEDDP